MTAPWDVELQVLQAVLSALEPLDARARARVLLHVVLALAPDALSDAQLWRLLQQAKALAGGV